MHNRLLLSPFLLLPSLRGARGGFQGRQPVLPIMIGTHPSEPFLSRNAALLMSGTFPSAFKRWSMPFYYPNFQNDMWRVFGYLPLDDRQHSVNQRDKMFYLDALKVFLGEKGVALFDTALRVRRAKNIASDKDLEIIEPADLDGLLRALPHCTAALTAGQKATAIFTDHFGATAPAMGQYVMFSFDGRPMRLYRMSGSSRVYPTKLKREAESYRVTFEDVLGLPLKKTE